MRPSRGMGDMRASKMPKGAMMAGGGDVKGKRASDEEADLARRIAEREAEAKKQAAAAAKNAPIRGQGYKKGGNFIKDAIKKPGALRASLGAKPGKPIPAGKLDKATKAPGKLGQRARFAEMLKGFKKNKK